MVEFAPSSKGALQMATREGVFFPHLHKGRSQHQNLK